MPPIEIEVSKFGSIEVNKLPDIGPNDPPGTFTDGNTLLIVSCASDDSGGFVSRSLGGGGVLLAEDKVRVANNFADLEAVIPRGGSYTVSIQSRVGLMTLKITHRETVD